jgi:hypothetical protein
MYSKKPPWAGRFFAVMQALAGRLQALKSSLLSPEIPALKRCPGPFTIAWPKGEHALLKKALSFVTQSDWEPYISVGKVSSLR